MSELVAALDKLKMGENFNAEYKWESTNKEELLTQLYFQMVRNFNENDLKSHYYKFLDLIFKDLNNNVEHLICIYKLIGHTRDIPNGKGEYKLTYFMINNLYNYKKSNYGKNNANLIDSMIEFIIEKLVIGENNDIPYGSWKDIKYLLNYHFEDDSKIKNKQYNIKSIIGKNNNKLLEKCITLICNQLNKDINSASPSLLCKWLPREKSKKFGWITPIIAYNLNKEWIYTCTTNSSIFNAKKKCLTNYRQTISNINKKLETTQIYQCDHRWGEIDFEKKVTSITLRKQSKAFLYTNKHTTEYNSEYYDRINCSNNYKNFIQNASSNKVTIKGKRVSIIDFSRDAYNLSNNEYYEKEIINSQWNDNKKLNINCGNMIAMVDTSYSMHDDKMVPLFSAIGLGIRIAEKSKFGNRVLTFNTTPAWINLDDIKDNFVDKVKRIASSSWGGSTNFRKALDMILDVAIQHNINPKEMENMSLVILSDMQIDYADHNSKDETMYDAMRMKYYNAGIRTSHKMPYPLPNIVFWNLRYTNGFPNSSSTKNTVMISGNSPILLNEFSTKGIEALKEITPIIMIKDILNNKRYDILEEKVKELVELNNTSNYYQNYN